MNSKEYFLQLLKWYIFGETGKYEDNVNWEEILRLSEIHSVKSMIFLSIDKFSVKPPIYDELKCNFLESISISIKQEFLMEQVISKLNEDKINHILIKGYVLRNYYPNKEARSFGDVDIYIDKDNLEKCNNSLIGLGFEYVSEKYEKYVSTYKKGLLYIEVHTSLIGGKLFNDFNYKDYFKKTVMRKVNLYGYTYELSKEDHLIYLILHMAKHFYISGVGIRMILDIVVYFQKFKSEIDINYLRKELEYIRLDKFADIIFLICNNYFNLDIKCSKININYIEDIMDYIVEHGVFGFDCKDVLSVEFNKDNDGKLKLLFKKIFPDVETLSRRFIWFKNGKTYMLPYAWIRRWAYFLLNKEKRESLGSRFLAILKDNKDVFKHNDILKKIGLK